MGNVCGILGESGSALMMNIIISVVLATGVIWFSHWSWIHSRQSVQEVAQQRARTLAESGLEEGRQWLKRPDLAELLPAFSSHTVTGVANAQGRFDVAVYRPFNNPLVELVATGYYYLNAGNVVDAGNENRRAQRAVVRAKVRLVSATEYLLAVPHSFTIGASADGPIYGESIHFEPTSPPQSMTVRKVHYSSLNVPTYAAGTDETWVNFPAGPPERLDYPVSFVTLDESIRAVYRAKRGPSTRTDFSGLVTPDGTSPVYYSEGDIHIGQDGPLTVSGAYAIYTTSNVIIHNNILVPNDGNSWVAILAEKDIILGGRAGSAALGFPEAADDLTLSGTFIANQNFISEGLAHPPTSSLSVNGSICAQLAIDPRSGWTTPANRHWHHQPSPNPNILLPSFTTLLEFRVVADLQTR